MAPLQQSLMLYVGDLDPAVVESDLMTAFSGSRLRPILIRLCHDRLTGNSLYYAYVNFSVLSQADDTMRVMNHKKVKGRPMRVMCSVRESLMRKNGFGYLFVKALFGDSSIEY